MNPKELVGEIGRKKQWKVKGGARDDGPQMSTKNRFAMLAEDDDEEEGVMTINAVTEDVVEVTIDSGASRSVWPMTKKGVHRSPLRKKVKLAAANGTEILVKVRQSWSSSRAARDARWDFSTQM